MDYELSILLDYNFDDLQALQLLLGLIDELDVRYYYACPSIEYNKMRSIRLKLMSLRDSLGKSVFNKLNCCQKIAISDAFIKN